MQKYERKVFQSQRYDTGVNAPPMHVWCRSIVVPKVRNWRDKFFGERKGKYNLSKYTE